MKWAGGLKVDLPLTSPEEEGPGGVALGTSAAPCTPPVGKGGREESAPRSSQGRQAGGGIRPGTSAGGHLVGRLLESGGIVRGHVTRVERRGLRNMSGASREARERKAKGMMQPSIAGT